MRRLALITVALVLAMAARAHAGQPVNLRANVSASGAITLGDLFDNPGSAASVVIGNAAPPGQTAVLDAGVVQQLARGHGLDWDNREGLQRILVPSAGGGLVAAGGPTGDVVEVLTYSHSLAAGDIVEATDVAFAKVPRFAVPQDAPRDPETVIGKSARRPLRSGAPVATHDLGNPTVIKRDDIVQVTYRADGVVLVLQGKAMADAGQGDPVDIQNTTSKKVVQAVVTGPDQAVVGPEADELRAAARQGPNQVAALP
jgi:flagellar basal body P-ring formation protein FlgA